MIFNLYRCVTDSPINGYHNCGYYETDAPKEIIEKIVCDIQEDDRLAIKDFSNAVVAILRARGYICEEYIIESFGIFKLMKFQFPGDRYEKSKTSAWL